MFNECSTEGQTDRWRWVIADVQLMAHSHSSKLPKNRSEQSWSTKSLASSLQVRLCRPEVFSPAPGELPSCIFQLQPQPRVVQGCLIIIGRWVGVRLELQTDSSQGVEFEIPSVDNCQHWMNFQWLPWPCTQASCDPWHAFAGCMWHNRGCTSCQNETSSIDTHQDVALALKPSTGIRVMACYFLLIFWLCDNFFLSLY